MQETARRAFIASLIFVAVVASALALWKLRIVLALLFLAKPYELVVEIDGIQRLDE